MQVQDYGHLSLAGQPLFWGRKKSLAKFNSSTCARGMRKSIKRHKHFMKAHEYHMTKQPRGITRYYRDGRGVYRLWNRNQKRRP